MMAKRLTSRPARLALTTVTLALVVAWALVLRPQILGGPASYVIVSGRSMEPTLRTGDLVVGLERSSYRAGDVVAYRVPKGDPGAGALVIHRITGGSAPSGYVTQGDNRDGADEWRPKPDDVLGRSALTLPRVGLLFMWVRTPLGLAIAAGLAAFLFVLAGSRRSRRRPRDGADEPYAVEWSLRNSRSLARRLRRAGR
jgi:signal peptidase